MIRSPGDCSFILPGEPVLLVHTAQISLGDAQGKHKSFRLYNPAFLVRYPS